MFSDDIFWILSTFSMVIDVCHHYQRRLADVIALNNNGWFYCHLFYFYWLLLLPILCLWQMLWPLFFMADVIAMVADVIATCVNGLMFLPYVVGWCYCQCFCLWQMLWPLFFMAGVIAMVADGIATCVNGLMFFFALLLIDGTAKCDSYWLIVADVMTTMWLADVVAMVADGIGHCWNVSMY